MNIIARLIGGASPFNALSQHLEKVMECVDLVIPILHAALAGDMVRAKEIAEQIFALEQEADEIKIELRDSLPKAKMLPVARPDLLAYLNQQDNLADKAEDLAMMLTVRAVKVPEETCNSNFNDELLGLAEKAVSSAKKVAEMFGRIDELKNRGFSGDIVEELRQAAAEVGRQEHLADLHQFRLVRCILSIDDPSWRFSSSYSLLEIVRSLGKLANHAESMSDYLRLMIAE